MQGLVWSELELMCILIAMHMLNLLSQAANLWL